MPLERAGERGALANPPEILRGWGMWVARAGGWGGSSGGKRRCRVVAGARWFARKLRFPPMPPHAVQRGCGEPPTPWGRCCGLPPTLQGLLTAGAVCFGICAHVNFLKLRDAGRVHHPVLCVCAVASARPCSVLRCAMTAPPAVAARVPTQQLLRDMLSSATPVPDTLVPAAAAALRQGCAPRPAPRGCGERQGVGFALAVYPG
jgi:hypothetical protein